MFLKRRRLLASIALTSLFSHAFLVSGGSRSQTSPRRLGLETRRIASVEARAPGRDGEGDAFDEKTVAAARAQQEVAIKVNVGSKTLERRELLEEIGLERETVTISKGQTISELLQDRRIAADAFAKSIVMDLNPDIERLGNLEVGQTVVLPTVNTVALNLTSDRPYHFAVANHLPQHSQLAEGLGMLKRQVAEVSAYPADRFGTAAAKVALLTDARKAIQSLEELQVAPLSSEARDVVIANAMGLSAAFNKPAGEQFMTAELLASVEAATTELSFIGERAKIDVNQQFVNVAAIIKGLPDPPARPVRVRCKVEGDFIVDRDKDKNNPKATYEKGFLFFPQLELVTTRPLQRGVKYYFWVVREADGKMVSPEPKVPLKIEELKNCPSPLQAAGYSLCYELLVTDPDQ